MSDELPDFMKPESLTAEEHAVLSRLRAEKRMLTILEPIWEQRRCQQWGIPYDRDAPAAHRAELLLRDLAQRQIYEQHTRNWKWLGAAGRAVGAGSASIASRLWNTLMGAAVLLGLGWLAARLGWKLPGVP